MKRLPRITLLVLIMVLIVSQTACAETTASGRFSDVSTSSPYYKAVSYCAEKGIVSGTGNGKFSPDVITDRGMFVTMFLRMTGDDGNRAEGEELMTFADVPPDMYCAVYITSAVRQKILYGSDENHMLPDKAVTTQDAACMIYRYYQSKAFDDDRTALNALKDKDEVADYAAKACAWAVNMKILDVSDGMLHPQKALTRAEAVQIIKNTAVSGSFDSQKLFNISMDDVKSVDVSCVKNNKLAQELTHDQAKGLINAIIEFRFTEFESLIPAAGFEYSIGITFNDPDSDFCIIEPSSESSVRINFMGYTGDSSEIAKLVYEYTK